MRLADYLAQAIVDKGVKDVFLLSGGGMMYLLDGLAKNKDLNLHFHHHEQNAGIAAEGYARITGGLGFCFATSGPGGPNLVEAITECWVDSVPVVFIIGQNKIERTKQGSCIVGLRQHGDFEIDIIPIVQTITKRAFFVTKAEEFGLVFDSACHEAQKGRPGPVVINIPLDMQCAEVTEAVVYTVTSLESETSIKRKTKLVCEEWTRSNRPLILAGQGIRKANCMDELLLLAKRFNTPIVTTQAANDVIPYDDEMYIGHVGIKGNRAGNAAVSRADFILCLGTSLNVLTTGYDLIKFAPQAHIFYVDPDPAQLTKCGLTNAEMINLTIQEFSHATLRYDYDRPDYEMWSFESERFKHADEAAPEVYENEKGRLNIYNVIKKVNEYSVENDIIVSDAGSSFYAVGQSWKIKKDQRHICSNGMGAMGWALPASTGAYIASKHRVLCFTGDGSLMTGINELAVLAREKANVKIFVFDNDGYVSIRNTQDTFFDSNYCGTDPEHGVNIPSIQALAHAFGIGYAEVNSDNFLDAVCSGFITNVGPAIIHVRTNRKQKIIPYVGSFKDEKGNLVSGSFSEMLPRGNT
jgi:acetolactate synthase-1/2/3 large subunit